MKNRKKLLGLGLAVSMGLLSACGSGGSGTAGKSAGSEPAAGEKPVELDVAFYIHTAIPADLKLVQDEVNKITKAKINATVKLTPISIGDYVSKSNLMLSSNEKLDLLVVSSRFSYSAQVTKGQLIPLDELIEKHGQDIKKVMDPAYLNATKVGGKMYAVPTLRDMAGANSVSMRKDLLDKAGVDLASIKTLDDVEGMLKAVKAKEPNVAPLIPFTPNFQPTRIYHWFDSLGDGLGVLPNYDNNLKVVNLYETPEYAAFLNKMRSWYTSGLILKDAATTKETPPNFMKAGTGFGYLNPKKPGVDAQESQKASTAMVSAQLGQPTTTTSNVTGVMWGIPTNSKTPDKAMQFLNLMYADKELVNLLNWGIEGKHYVKAGDNVVDFAPGVNAGNSGYNVNLGYLWGNQFLSSVFKGSDPNLWKDMEKFNQSAVKSKALGFNFDTAPVKTEVSAVTNVINEYVLGLEYGMLDPAQKLPEFIAKLKSAGIDKIIAEKQKQLDAWAKTK